MPNVSDPCQNHILAALPAEGYEGVISVARYMGSETTPTQAIVQSAGHAYRLHVNTLLNEFNHHSELHRLLLLSLDRLTSNEIVMTRELISNMLGVRREDVTEAAGRLQ